MTRAFNEENVVKNLYGFMGNLPREYLPHGVTVNEFLERLEPAELENKQSDIVYQMIRRKTFDDAKVLKRWQGNIEHACSWNEKAQKNHYLLEQISDFMKQLYEYFFLKKNKIIKAQKEISSELLASFGSKLTETEDMQSQLNKSALD